MFYLIGSADLFRIPAYNAFNQDVTTCQNFALYFLNFLIKLWILPASLGHNTYGYFNKFIGFCLFLIYISDSKHSRKDIFMTDTFWRDYIANWKLVLVNSCSKINIEDHRLLFYSICVKSTN